MWPGEITWMAASYFHRPPFIDLSERLATFQHLKDLKAEIRVRLQAI